MVRAILSVLCLASVLASSTQSAGVGGMLSSPVPKTGGGRFLVLVGACILRPDGVSDKLLTLVLCGLVAGGGPGGGGGRGIPGSQPRLDGDRVREWLVARDVPALPTTGSAETALLEDGGCVESSNPAPIMRSSLLDGDNR